MSDAAWTTIVAGMVTMTTMIVGFLTMWMKLRYGVAQAEQAAIKAKAVEVKLDENTRITREGTAAAAENAATAATVADRAREAAEAMTEQLNGGLEQRITAIVEKHMAPLVTDIKDIKQALKCQ